MKRRHLMPFGAEPAAAGGTRFRLWAPGADAITLALDDGRELPMTAAADGWFERRVADAGPGCRYRYRLADGLLVPDPASRYNPEDIHGPSEVVAAEAYAWSDGNWRGRPWEEAVIYELHVGSFSRRGDFAGVEERLDYLAELGVTALEIMPVADFPGRRNWGYDGVLPFAPDAAYGRPEDFKRLIDASHQRGLMVLLDVVYNHFGPEGNYLHCYCCDFFNPRHHTPWGAAINFDGASSRPVRDFFVHNALYWLEEFHLDGLRLDAIHAIRDDSQPDIVDEIAAAVRAGPGRQRQVHLVLEDDRNSSHYLARDATGAPRGATAQWNDDIHHALHVIATGEADGYYADYAADPITALARCLAEGFAFQGEVSAFRGDQPRGEPSGQLPPGAFVNFLQTHDQVGNRAFGERIGHLAPGPALKAVSTILLLAPQPPLIFMGEEFAARQPFLFFCDFGAELAQAVTEGRRREFAGFARFADPAAREAIPDPNAEDTFASCILDWADLDQPPQAAMLAHYRSLLALRQREIAPRLAGMAGGARVVRQGQNAFRIQWRLGDGSGLELLANLGPTDAAAGQPPDGRILFTTSTAVPRDCLPPWYAAWHLTEAA